jgi:hypothetical protein
MENEKIVWSPEAKIEVTGREFEFFARLTSLFEVPLTQVSTKELSDLFIPAIQSSQEILKRMIEAGIATKESDIPQSSEGTIPFKVEKAEEPTL